jgi:quercetin dioxygenase-like cupin family protein
VHNGPVVGSIVDGSAVFQIDGEPETVLRPGDVFYEPEGARITRFDAQEAGVTFLAYSSCSDRARSPSSAFRPANTV